MNLAKNLRKYFRRRFRVIVKKEEYFMKYFMKWSLSMILIVAMVLVVISIGFTQEKVTITVQDYFRPGEDSYKCVEEVAVEFKKNHPDVEVNQTYIPFAQLLPTMLQESLTKTLPDILMADNPWLPQLIKAGTLKDITDKVKEWGWENWEDFFKGYREITSSEGKIYAFQYTTNNLALFYRKSLLDKAGIANPPETWQELKEDCKKIREVLDIYGFAFDAEASEEGSWQFFPFLWSNGGSLLELDQPEAIEALQFLTEMVKEGYVPRDIVNINGQGDLTKWFINGEVAFMVNGNWEFGWQLTEDVMQRMGDVNVAPIPVREKGMRTMVPFGGECFGISSNIDPVKYDLAWEFLKLLVSSDSILRLNVNGLGGLPTRASAAEKISVEELPFLKIFLEQSQYALPRPLMGGIDKYPEVSSTVWVAVQKALTGIATPEEAFKEAARTIQRLFSPEDYEKYKQLARKLLQEASGK
jgi:multiple sugar transport system substrate-binding protein